MELFFIPDSNAYYLAYLNATVYLFANDFLSDQVKRTGMWEFHVLCMFDRLLTRDAVVLDVGAHIGLHSIYLAQRVHQVHSFEPVPETVRLLRQNIQMNHLDNVNIHPIGLADTEQLLDGIHIPNNAFHTVCARLGTNVDIDANHFFRTRIHIRPLDAWEQEHPLPRLDLIKLDVEGAEERVIQGALRVLQKFKPIVIMENYTPDKDDPLIQLGYTRRKIGNSIDYLYVYGGK